MTDWWDGKPWRMIQTNLREIDMLDMDAARYVRELQAFKATAVLVNMAGILASYPTKLPFHFQSPYLKGDGLDKVIAACHAADIRILARTDFSKIRRPIYEAHPEWAYLTPQGEIVDYNGDVHACVNGGFQHDCALEIIRELLAGYDVDGIFFNMGGYQVRDYSGNYHGICHCEACQRLFREMFSLPLPKAEDMADPVYRKYMVFKKRTLKAHAQRVYEHIRSLRPELCVANHLAARRGIVRQESNTAIARPLPHWQYSASENTKWVVSSYPTMISSNTTVDFLDFPYRHVAVSPHQQSLRLAQNLANGGALDYYLIGRLDNHEDKSGYEGVKALFHFHAAHEGIYQGLTSKACIGLLNGPEANTSEFRGWFRFLVEGHFPFDTIMVDTALELPWHKYQLIIVPDYQPLSDALAARLDKFVAEGGTLVAVSRAGWRDEDYEPRVAPALQCLGITRINALRQKMTSAYVKFERKEGFRRFPATELVFLDGNYVYADYVPGVQQRMKLIPPHMFGPPERCYYTQVTEQPGFTVAAFGRGIAIYLPWEPGALFHRQGYTNTADFATDLLEGIAGVEPVGGNLSPMVEATLFAKQDGSYDLLHLVNTSGHFGVSFYAPVTMSDLEVVIPFAGVARSVRGLVAEQDLAYTQQGDRLTIKLDKLGLFEAIRIER